MLYNANHSGLLLTQSSKRSYFNDLYKSLGKEAEITYINKNHNYHRIICKTARPH